LKAEEILIITAGGLLNNNYFTTLFSFFHSFRIMKQKLASSKVFYSCPSLPNLSATNATYNAIWLAAQNALTYTLNDNRRKSWTAIEDLTDCTKNSHKSSVSLTSLDSEEQESLRTNERLHNRTNRNSTGGISTHSLNEAELAVNIYSYSLLKKSSFD